MRFTLPYPPSTNLYWRVFRGRAVKSAEAREYIATVAKMLCGRQPETGPVSLWLDIYRPRKAGDLSNRIKVLEDALQGAAYFDDSQVVEIHARRFDDKANPRVEVEVTGA